MYLVSLFVGQEREQAETEWRIRMGIVADSRAADVNRWFDQQFTELFGVAQNQQVQTYIQQITQLAGDQSQQDQVQGLTQYLRDILTATADRAGFSAKVKPDINVNQTVPPVGGVMIIDDKGNVLAASPNSPAYDGDVKAFVSSLQQGQKGVSDL